MRYVFALIACFAIFFAYIIVVKGIMQVQGGAIPMLIMFAAMYGAWSAITKKK